MLQTSVYLDDDLFVEKGVFVPVAEADEMGTDDSS